MGRPRLLAGLLATGVLLGLAQAAPAAAEPRAARSVSAAVGSPSASPAPAPARSRAVMSQRGGVFHQRRVLAVFAPRASQAGSVAAVRAAASPASATAVTAPVDVFASGGELLGDTAVIVYWNGGPGSAPSGFAVELHDAVNGAQVGAVIAKPPLSFLCPQRTVFCVVFSVNNCWAVVAGHNYSGSPGRLLREEGSGLF